MNTTTATDNVAGNPTDRYQYNGKERNIDLNWYEYGFRWYDPATARFIQVDPLAMDYPFKSTYDYAENRPVNSIDIDGLESAMSIGTDAGIWMNKNLSTKEKTEIYTLGKQVQGTGALVGLGVVGAIYTGGAYGGALTSMMRSALTFGKSAYGVKAGAGILGDVSTQMMSDEPYNITGTAVQLYQGIGADWIQPLLSSSLEFTKDGFTKNSIVGGNADIGYFTTKTFYGYWGNRWDGHLGKDGKSFIGGYIGELTGNIAGDKAASIYGEPTSTPFFNITNTPPNNNPTKKALLPVQNNNQPSILYKKPVDIKMNLIYSIFSNI